MKRNGTREGESQKHLGDQLKGVYFIFFSMFSLIKEQVFLSFPANKTWQSVASSQRAALS